MDARIIFKYFPDLSEEQKALFRRMDPLYREWNEKVNVISRKDIDNLYERHVLHSLAIAKYIRFKPETNVLDLGTGGGFPGLPLAVLFPRVNFLLIDGTAKKLVVVREIADELGLENIDTQHIRAESLKASVDFVLSRAVAPLDQLVAWSRPLISDRASNALPNGLIALKGGDIAAELKKVQKNEYAETENLSTWFEEDFFAEKKLVYVQL